MKKNVTIYLDILFATLLGVSLTLSLAPFSIYPLAFLAPFGLLALWMKYPNQQYTFLLGYFFGLGLFTSGIYWIYISIHQYANVPIVFSLLIIAALIGALSLFNGFQGYYFAKYFHHRRTKILFAFPALWFLTEFARAWLFTGFPWLLIGYSQLHSPLKGYAPIFSVYGISFAVVLSASLLYWALECFKLKQFKSSFYAIIILLSIWLIGGLVSFIPWTKASGNAVPVSLVQGNIPQELKWSPENLQLSIDRYNHLSNPLFNKDNIIFWPEGAIPLPLTEAQTFIDMLEEKAKKNGSSLVLGIPVAANDNDFYNAIYAISDENQIYSKRRLVPFGEYLPYPQLFSALFHYLNIPMSMEVPGDLDQKPFILNGVQILPSICFEIAFPELINTSNSLIGVLLTVTNDAWFGKSIAQAQHLQIAQMRALEFKRPLLFVSNNGITAIINQNGNIQKAAPPHEIFVLNGEITPRIGLTPWMKNGTDSILFIVFCFLFIAIKNRREQQR